MDVSFIKISPTQNVTILVTDAVSRACQPAVAARLLAYDGVGGEQAGFLEAAALPGARARLQMMGGEFCGNASMSMGAYFAWQDGLDDGAQADYCLEVSGAEKMVHCHIERRDNVYRGTVQMPLPEGFGDVELETDAGTQALSIVHLPGISHVIAPVETGIGREQIERRIRAWASLPPADSCSAHRPGRRCR